MATAEDENVVNLAAAKAEADRKSGVAAILSKLQLNDKKAPIGSVSNVIIVLSHDPVLAPLFAYDEFSCRHVMRGAPPCPVDDEAGLPGPYPRPWDSADIVHIQSYIQRVWIRSASRGDVEDAMLAVAAANRFHPVRDWLAALQWDGISRLDGWLVSAFGSPDDEYHSAVGAKFLIAAVRRVRRPGCKFDHMPIFEGLQGIGKSTVLRTLVGDPWFTDALPAALGSRDAALALEGVWIMELAEIEQLIRSEVATIKAFLSRASDRFRAPYARTFQEHPRQCVLVGTTNETDYLRDSSGNRRFWPIACTLADVEWTAENRIQLWAEAAAREATGETHWLSEHDWQSAAVKHQAERLQEDAWEERIRGAVGLRMETNVGEILSAIGVSVERQDRSAQMRVAKVLRQDGWQPLVRWEGGKPVRGWQRTM